MKKSMRLGHSLDLGAFRDGVDAGLASVAGQVSGQCSAAIAPSIGGTTPATAQEWLDDLHMALAAPDPDDDIAPCIAEKFGDIAHDIHRSAQEIDK